MDKKELLKYCLANEDSAETYPFKDYPEMAVIRHKSNNKWFALIFYLNKKLYVNLKCNPWDAAVLRDEYPYVKPAWHMNKVHWNTVDVAVADKDVLKQMIENSFELTKPHKRTN